MKRTLVSAALLLTIAAATGACSSAPTPDDTDGSEAAFSMPEGEALTTYLDKVMGNGKLDVADDAVAKPALARLDAAVGANLEPLLAAAGTGLVDDGTEVLRVTRADGATSLLSFHSFKNHDSTATLGLVRVEGADGSTRTFAERDVRHDQSADGNAARQVASTLYAVSDRGITKLDNVVDDAATPPDALTTSAIMNGLHITDDSMSETFGSPKTCTACKDIVTGIKAAQPVLVFLLTHHFFTAACVGVGVAAGAAATPETLGAGTVPAAAAGYRGCRIIMAGAAALIALGATLPDTDDTPGKAKYCNKIASFIPGASAWCVDQGASSCALGKIHVITDPAAQCAAVGACARDSKCPSADGFCSSLFLGDSESAKSSRALCAKVDAVACSANIQSVADLKVACGDLTAH